MADIQSPKVHKFTLRMKHKNKIQKMYMVSGDSNSDLLVISLEDSKDGYKFEPFVLQENSIVTVVFLKEDGNTVTGQAQISGPNEIQYLIKGNEISFPGIVEAQVQVYGTSSRISTWDFSFNVSASLDDGEGVESTTEYHVLTDLINDVTGIATAESLRNTAEEARVQEESSRQSAETLRVSAENARASNEILRNEAEATREAAEGVRNTSFSQWHSSEVERRNREIERIEAEDIRNSSEITRVSNENARKSAESIRNTNEDDRISAELLRISAESSRASSENTRTSKEAERQSAETERIANEAIRDTAEGLRILAEKAREDAEDLRKAGEDQRVLAETEREQSLTTALTNVQGAISDAIEATERANQAAETANTAAANVKDGLSAYEVAVQNGFSGTEQQWIDTLKGASAYEVWIAQGNEGTVEDYLASLKGDPGEVTQAEFDALEQDFSQHKNDYTTQLNYIQSFAPIFGATWDKSSNPILTRTHDAVNLVANVGVDAQIVRNDFDAASIFGDIVESNDSYGNVFVRIPKFYIRKTDGNDIKTWQISKGKRNGFYLPWCFWDFDKGRELPYIDVGKYKASLSLDNRLESKPNTAPLVSSNIVQFRDYARANNTNGLAGYQQLDVHVYDVIQTLFYIEFATLNSQSIMQGFTSGRYGAETDLATVSETDTNRIIVSTATAAQYRVGQTISVGTARYGTQVFYGRTITAIEDYDANNKAIIFDGFPVDIAAGNFLQNTGAVSGFSSKILASSGSIGSNSDGKYPCMYRGIESPYGDMYQFVDGININDLQVWVALNATDYASNVFASPYKELGYLNAPANGYIKEMGFDSRYPFAEFPIEIGAGASTYYADYYYQNTGQRIALVGGNWSDGAAAGLSFWILLYTSSITGVNIGGRLLRKPL